MALSKPGVLVTARTVSIGMAFQVKPSVRSQARTRRIEQGQQVVGAVFVEEKVVKASGPQLPGMREQTVHFRLAQVEVVLPDVAVFEVVVVVDAQERGSW